MKISVDIFYVIMSDIHLDDVFFRCSCCCQSQIHFATDGRSVSQSVSQSVRPSVRLGFGPLQDSRPDYAFVRLLIYVFAT